MSPQSKYINKNYKLEEGRPISPKSVHSQNFDWQANLDTKHQPRQLRQGFPGKTLGIQIWLPQQLWRARHGGCWRPMERCERMQNWSFAKCYKGFCNANKSARTTTQIKLVAFSPLSLISPIFHSKGGKAQFGLRAPRGRNAVSVFQSSFPPTFLTRSYMTLPFGRDKLHRIGVGTMILSLTP